MQDLGSVLPDRNFVQTGAITSIKFNVSVAGALHLGRFRGPKVEQLVADFPKLASHGSNLSRELGKASARVTL